MSASEHLLSIAREVQALTAGDRERRGGLRQRVVDVQTELQLAEKDDLAGYLDAVLTLIDGIFRLPESCGPDMAWLAGSLLEVVGKAHGSREGAPDAAPTPEEDPGNEWLERMSDLYLGDILVRIGALNREQVEDVLQVQVHTGKRFGEIVVETGLATAEDVELALDLQSGAGDGQAESEPAPPRTSAPASQPQEPPPALASGPESVRSPLRMADPARAGLGGAPRGPQGPAPAPDLPAFTDLLLGEMLLKREKIDEAQLESALAIQRATGKRVGEALVQIGAIGWKDLDIAIRQQRKARERKPGGGSRRRVIEL